MFKRLTIIFGLFVLALPAVASAAEVPADTTSPRTLAEYLARARLHNPTLKGADAEARASRERVGVAKGLSDPTLLYGYYIDADEEMEGRSEITLMQELPFFGKRGMRGDVAARMADADTNRADAMALDVEWMVRVDFYELVRTVEVARVLNREREVLERMSELARARYSSGTGEQFELLKLEVEIAEVDDQRSMNKHERDMVTARLNELIGREGMSLSPPQWEVPAHPNEHSDSMLASALVTRPEMAAALRGVEAAEASRRLAKREYIPDFVFGVKYEFGGGEDHFGNEMGDSWELMAGINLPIWLGKRRAMSREAEAMHESALHGVDAARLRIARDVEEAEHGVLSAHERLVRFETEILPRAEQAMESAESAYRAGRADFLSFLDSQRTLLAMRKQYYGVVADMGAQVAALDRALGRRE